MHDKRAFLVDVVLTVVDGLVVVCEVTAVLAVVFNEATVVDALIETGGTLTRVVAAVVGPVVVVIAAEPDSVLEATGLLDGIEHVPQG